MRKKYSSSCEARMRERGNYNFITPIMDENAV